MLYAQALQEYHANKKWILTYDFKSDNKVYLNIQNLNNNLWKNLIEISQNNL